MIVKTRRYCFYCHEEIEHLDGVGWVEVGDDGHYDICPDSPAALREPIDDDEMKHRPMW
ncbi:hypothetical protein FB384_004930 [Prauserella sediminis]|uniref:Uncharacterized protein n=1 Tax=Prauserella sediminis TaxID=577680 RepID=A0A839XTE0_9PSEU|nr:hypothetical protein [Prauserella sediminis]MBB3665971.1 hypothetical protein [Prauserella sediminis]